MKNTTYIKNAIFAFFVCFGQLCLATEIPEKLLFEKSLPETNKFINSLVWPAEAEKIGFKSLLIGDSFNLDDFKNVRTYVYDRDSLATKGEPFVCKFVKVVPVFDCKMVLLSNSKDYSQKLKDMNTAFGEPIKLKFNVMLSNAITQAEIDKYVFGTGLIQEITITNDQSTRDFVLNAASYFTEKLNYQPKTKTIFKNPAEIYTKICTEIVKRVENKAVSTLSIKEQNELKKCEDEAALIVLSGKATSGKQTRYEWKSTEGKVHVVIISEESNLSIGTSTPQISSNSTSIYVGLNLRNSLAAWKDGIKKIKDDYAKESTTKSKTDF
jgi:hypothetical protein